MYRVEKLDAPSALPESPLALPVDVLLSLPGPDAPRFNLIGAMGLVLGQFGWERATKIIKPRLYAPGWTDDALDAFLRQPFQGTPHEFPGEDPGALDALDFLGLEAPFLAQDAAAQQAALDALFGDYDVRLEDLDLAVHGREGPIYRPQYDIVHLFGRFGGDGMFVLGGKQRVDGFVLRDLLGWAQTRLLILHVPPHDGSEGEAMARAFVEDGLPAALVVTGTDPDAVDEYYLTLYADIVHNQWLEELARPRGAAEAGIDAVLLHVPGASDILQFHAWLEQLRERFAALREEARARRDALETLRFRAQETLSERRRNEFLFRLQDTTVDFDRLNENVEENTNLLQGDLDWAHESGGAEPLSRIGDTVSDLTADADALDALYSDLEGTLEMMERSERRSKPP